MLLGVQVPVVVDARQGMLCNMLCADSVAQNSVVLTENTVFARTMVVQMLTIQFLKAPRIRIVNDITEVFISVFSW